MTAMFQGAEAYLEMWERADGVPAAGCLRPGRFSAAGLGRAQLGANAEQALFAAGQPVSRPGRSYRYCVAGDSRAAVASVFDAAGRVALIAGTARGEAAAGIAPGTSARRLRGTRSLGGAPATAAVRVGRRLARGARYLYGVRGGRVTFAAVASASELRSPARVRSDLRAAGL
jgi:hypothetical protein